MTALKPDKRTNDRYRAADRFEHGCCYTAVVEDLTAPVMIGGKHYRDRHDLVCECPGMKEAEMIAKALNLSASDEQSDKEA